MPSSTTPTHLLLLLLLLLLLFITFFGGDSTATSQCSTLLDFKQSFNYSSSKLDTWHPRTNCCFNWEGVTCDPLSGLVIGLDLSHCKLAGNINNNSTLFNLTSLRTLNLAHNLFDPSPIPNGFELLTNLTSLNLSTAGFKGQIPIGIAKLVNLVSLDLSTFNTYTTPLRVLFDVEFLYLKNPDFETLIRNMSNLRELYLDGVDMSSSAHGYQWSAAVAKWTPKLRALSLSRCSITGPFHSSFARLHNLSVIRLDYNQLNCPVPEFLLNFSSLHKLSLGSCGLNGVNPNTFVFLLRHLTVLSLFGNDKLSGLLPDFPDESKLERLELSYSNFSGMIPSSVGNLQHLTFLGLSRNKLSGQIPSSIGNLQHLTYLDLYYNQLSGQIPSSVDNLQHLTFLDLSQNQLSGKIPSSIGNLLHLTDLVLFDNQLSGQIPSSIGNLQHLTELELSDNQISGQIPSSIGNLQRLTDLVLFDNQLSGQIPSSIGNLQQLTELELSDNQISGQIPSSIGNLQHLTFLDLSQNQLSGQIPSSIGNLQHLTFLDLDDNQLSGQIPSSIGNLQHLTILDLGWNQLSGQIPSSIGNLQHLTVLYLGNNLLQGEIPRSVFHCSRLILLFLGHNNFTDTLELDQFSSFRNLTMLDLSYIGISIHTEDVDGSISLPNLFDLQLASCNLTKVPSFLRYTNQLENLDLSNNKIVGSVPNWIWGVGNGSLQLLNLSYNIFTYVEVPLQNISMYQGISIDLHSNLIAGPILLPPTTISLLDYSNNNFSSSIPSNISSYLASRAFLSLANNSIVGEIPPSVCNASNLNVLDFSNNKLSGLIPPCLLKGSYSLKVLNLRGNQLHGTIPQNISRGCGLQTLNLNGNYLEGRLPQSLANCSSLEFLDLGNNHINDAFPFWLGNFSSLRVLVLSSNQLYGPVDPPLGTKAAEYFFPKLQILDISSNYFNGSLPFYCIKHLKAMMVNSVVNRTSVDVHYGYNAYYLNTVTFMFKGFEMELVKTLTIFTAIDFSNNNFEGIIPETIGELKSLIVLNISHNALDGNIPPSIGNLLQLESLDLSGNKLSGSIPQELSDLTFLSSLNLSNNNLVGKIPQGNQLSTFSNASFNGNERLCGVPLTKLCNNATPAITNGKLVPLKSNHSLSTYVVGLALSIGLGFGVGFAVVILLQNISWKSWKRQISGRS